MTETACQAKVSFSANAHGWNIGETGNMPQKTALKSKRHSPLYLKEWRKLRGMTQEAVAEALQTEKGTISKLERGLQRYHQEWLEALAELFDISPADLLQPPEKPVEHAAIPVFGEVGAGEHVALAEGGSDVAIDAIEPPAGDDGWAAVIVRGDSMVPAYHPGDALFFLPHGRRAYALEELYERDCVVITTAGDAYVKRVRRGRAPGLVDLVSHNPAVAPLYDLRLRWGAPVLWIRRRQ